MDPSPDPAHSQSKSAFAVAGLGSPGQQVSCSETQSGLCSSYRTCHREQTGGLELSRPAGGVRSRGSKVGSCGQSLVASSGCFSVAACCPAHGGSRQTPERAGCRAYWHSQQRYWLLICFYLFILFLRQRLVKLPRLALSSPSSVLAFKVLSDRPEPPCWASY